MDVWRCGWAVLVLFGALLVGGSAWGFHLSERKGLVVVERNGAALQEGGGHFLHAGDTVRIEGQGQAFLKGPEGQSIVLGDASALAFSSDGQGRQAFRMVEGLVRIKSASATKITAPHLQLWCTRADLLVYVVQDVTSVFVLSGIALAENLAGRQEALTTGKRLVATGTLYELGHFEIPDRYNRLDQEAGVPESVLGLVRGMDGGGGYRQNMEAQGKTGPPAGENPGTGSGAGGSTDQGGSADADAVPGRNDADGSTGSSDSVSAEKGAAVG